MQKGPSYCRKDKSLGVLCTNFLELYNRDGVDTVVVDDAAVLLGVERRRIYDIVNILESIGILQKRAKNQYSWKGYDIPGALEVLKEEGLKEEFGAYISKALSQKDHRLPPDSKTEQDGKGPELDKNQRSPPDSKTDQHDKGLELDKDQRSPPDSKAEQHDEGPELDKNQRLPPDSKTEKHEKGPKLDQGECRREKSLWLLTRNFIKLFLCSDVQIISLECAALALPGDSSTSTARRTKVRRLYDIANVFSSMDLIEKTRDPKSGKPAIKWIGGGKNYEGSNCEVGVKSSKRRAFGTDISNTVKRINTNSSDGLKVNENLSMGRWWKDTPGSEKDDLPAKKHEKHVSKDFVFGPFAPPNIVRVEGQRNRNNLQIHDSESLSIVYRPQYANKAWNSWYAEAQEKQKTQPGPSQPRP